MASWGAFESEIFAVHEDGVLRNRYWDGTAWHAWEPMGDGFAGPVAASARAADRIDVMAVDARGRVRHRWWDGTRWVEWRDLAGAPDARDVGCSWVGDELRVFVTARDGSVWYTASG